MRTVSAVIFHRPWGDSKGEKLVRSCRQAAVRDLVESLRQIGLRPHIVLPNADRDASWLQDLEVDVARSNGDGPFHFGEALKEFIRSTGADGVLYFGSGSGFLLERELLEALRAFAQRDEPSAVLNNFYSCDFAAVARAEALLDITLPEIDNPLGFALADAGIPCSALSRSAETQFDLDTPTDVFILRASERGGSAIRSSLDALSHDHHPIDEIQQVMTDRTAHLCFAGRVNPRTWADIESRIACRTSGLIEGRGLRSQRTPHPPVARQVLLESGPVAFFERIARAYDGAIVDTRPFLADGGLLPTPDVRFSSDLLLPDLVADAAWKTFTEAAIEAPIPILLGGHSTVSGGLYLLAESCWKGRDLLRRLHPEPFDPDKERP